LTAQIGIRTVAVPDEVHDEIVSPFARTPLHIDTVSSSIEGFVELRLNRYLDLVLLVTGQPIAIDQFD